MQQRLLADEQVLATKANEAKQVWLDHIVTVNLTRRKLQDLMLSDGNANRPKFAVLAEVVDCFNERIAALRTRGLVGDFTHLTISSLISEGLPTDIHGRETGNSLLLRGIRNVASHLTTLSNRLARSEYMIANVLAETDISLAILLEGVREMSRIALMAHNLQATPEKDCEGCKFGQELMELRESLKVIDGGIAVAEVELLKIKRTMAKVGIRVARQRLVDEFFKSMIEDDTDAADAGSGAIEGARSESGQSAGGGAHVEEDADSRLLHQRLMTDFFLLRA